ncbi:MAG TPA: hypothetical protein VGQ75_11125 [Thermoanaerobaculia bacterium]|nr:hypothetical protein [Thermoanaerobaculia bacterium]HEV8609533.1 hypothetical protein [Thermoanaerobaculia bacterium]
MKTLRPKKPQWLLVTLAIAGAALGVRLVVAIRQPWHPGRTAGLLFGIAASVLYLMDLLYPLRRKLLAFPLGNAQTWIQLHIYGGVLAFFFVLVHEGFRWPVGRMGWLLLSLSGWATVSGLVGVWLQKWVPAALASGLKVEALFERIPDLVEKSLAEADALMAGASEMLERFYSEDVRPALAGIDSSWGYLTDVRSGRDRRLEPFSRISRFLAEEERPRLEDLKAVYTEKLELDAQYSLQRILRGWVAIHVPPCLLLFGLMLFHIWTSLSYD